MNTYLSVTHPFSRVGYGTSKFRLRISLTYSSYGSAGWIKSDNAMQFWYEYALFQGGYLVRYCKYTYLTV